MAQPKKKFNINEESEANAQILGNKKKFTIHDLVTFQPKTKNQEKFLEMYYSQVPISVLRGVAGTGKTALAFYSALTEVFDSSTPFEKLVMVRSAVETRKVGFLPGSLDDKGDIYESPYKMMTEQFVKYKSAYTNLKALGYYEFVLTSYLRGMTFDNCIVIVEEAQNLDYSELHTVITRMGINSKVIITGDSRQDDLKRQREKSGFEKFNKVLAQMPYDMVGFIDFEIEDVVRSELIKHFLIADHEFGGD